MMDADRGWGGVVKKARVLCVCLGYLFGLIVFIWYSQLGLRPLGMVGLAFHLFLGFIVLA